MTEKYQSYYNISSDYVKTVVGRMRQRFSPEEQEKLTEMLQIVTTELMPEVSEGIRLP